MNYQEFLESKLLKIQDSGFEISESELNPMLFDFQKFLVKLALKKGRFALFEDCGLGKTPQQLEWAYQIFKKENKPILIICPLAVSGQTIKEGVKFGYEVIKLPSKQISKSGIYITNYEQIEHINANDYIGIVLDESSILKNYTGVYKTKLIELFKFTKYKLCCTATPSPNDHTEIGNHSEFLNIMSRNEMLSMFFVHDASHTQDWRLKGHAKKRFLGLG